MSCSFHSNERLNHPIFFSALIQNEKWMNIRSGIHLVLNSIPQCVISADRNAFAQSMLLFEQWIASQQSGVREWISVLLLIKI